MCDVDIKWPSTCTGLKALDQHLRCGICYEYLKTAMVTSCSHNYCSVCIRKSLQYRTQCPSCFEETVESHLRNNRVLDELVRIFAELRDDLIYCIRVSGYRQSVVQNIGTCGLGKNSVVPAAPQREPIVSSTPRDTPESLRSPVINSRSRLIAAQNSAAKNLNNEFDKHVRNTFIDRVPQPSTSSAVETIAELSNDLSSTKEEMIVKRDVHIPSIFSPKKPGKAKVHENKVACPVCSVDVSEMHINQHLDACLKTPQKQKKVVKREPLPKLVYNLMKEKQLRQKLKEAGLSTHGDYKMMVQRHARYTLLYNAECDTLDPRPVAEIVQQVEREERDEKENQASAKISGKLKLVIDKKSDPKAIEEAKTKYLQENKESFNQLIHSLRQREGKLSSYTAEEVQSKVEKVAARKQFSRKLHISDSDPDSPDEVEMVELSDDDSAIFDQQTMANSADVSRMCEVTYGGMLPEEGLQTVPKPVMNRAAEDDDCTSNRSFSLLENFDTDSMTDSRMAENGPSKVVLTEDSDKEECESGRNSTVDTQQMSTKLLDSQLEDPNYEPDTQDMLDLDNSNEGPVTWDYQNNRLQPPRSRTGTNKLVEVKNGRKKLIVKHHVGAVSTGVSKITHFETRFSGEELIPNSTRIHPGQSVISGNQSEIQYSGEDEAGNNVRTRGKRKVLSGCGGNECSENNSSSEDFVSGSKKDRVRIKFLNGQQSQERILRKRTKR